MYAPTKFNKNLAVVSGIHAFVLAAITVLPGIWSLRENRIVNPIPIDLIMTAPLKGKGISDLPKISHTQSPPKQEVKPAPPAPPSPPKIETPPPSVKENPIVVKQTPVVKETPVVVKTTPVKDKNPVVVKDEIRKTQKTPPPPKPPTPKPALTTKKQQTPTIKVSGKPASQASQKVSASAIRDMLNNAVRDVGGPSGTGSRANSPAIDMPATGDAGTGESSPYWTLIYRTFYEAWSQPGRDEVGNSMATVTITLDRYGRITGRQLTQRSGVEIMDKSVMQAVMSVSRIDGLPPAFAADHPTIRIEFKLEQ